MSMANTLLVLAAGMSSRMKASNNLTGLTSADLQNADTLTKGLIPLGNEGKPLLEYILDNAANAGVKHVILITGKDNSAFLARYGNRERHNPYGNLIISYAIQHIPEDRSKPFGTADAVFQALEQFPELQHQEFLVCNCDNLYSESAFRALVETRFPHAFIAYDRDGLLFPSEKIARFALCLLDENDLLSEIIEKPDPANLANYSDRRGIIRVSMNVFKFSGNPFFHYLKNCPVTPSRNEKELVSAISNLIKAQPGTMVGIPFKEHVPDLTVKDDISQLRKYLQK